MSANEKKGNIDRKDQYNPPEIVRLGDALELTEGGGDPLSDGYTNPKTYKGIDSEPSVLPTVATNDSEKK